MAQPLSQRRVNTVLGQIYVGYLWSSRDEPMGLNYWTQKVSIVEVRRWRSDGSGVFEQTLHKRHMQLSELRYFRLKSRLFLKRCKTMDYQVAQGSGCLHVGVNKKRPLVN